MLRRAAEEVDAEAELEARLASLKGGSYAQKRAVRDAKAGASSAASAEAGATAAAAAVDWGTEVVFYEGPPSRGDLAVNVLLGFTLLWLARARPRALAHALRQPLPFSRALSSHAPTLQPLSLAAVGRAIWVNYKITDKRVSVASTSPLNMEKLDATYDQMVEVRAIGRGVGLWGDMVIVLNDGAKIEIRCIDKCVPKAAQSACVICCLC